MDDEYLSQELTQPTEFIEFSGMPVTRKRKYGRKKYTTEKRVKRSNSFRRRRSTRPSARSRKYIRSIALSLAENKSVRSAAKFATPPATTSNNFYHDVLNFYTLHNSKDNIGITVVNQGNTDTTRNGSDIYSVGFRVRGTFTLPYDRRNTIIKMWLVSYNLNQGSLSNFFVSTTGNSMLDPVNNNVFKGAKLLRVLRAKSRDLYVERGEITDDGSDASIYYDIWIPYKRLLRYASATGVCPCAGIKEVMGIVMVAYDSPSTLSTDIIVNHHEQFTEFFYRDP